MGRTIKLLLLFFAYQLAVSGVLTILFMLWNHTTEVPNAMSDSYGIFLLVIQVVFSALVSAHLIIGKYVKLDKSHLRFCSQLVMWMLSLTLIVGMSLWNNYLSELFQLPNTMEDFLQTMMSHPLGIVATVIMAPLMEELLFRGAIQGHLMRIWKNPWWAILLSSLLFGLVHGNPAQIPFAFVIGIGLGWMYYKTGSLIPCFFMHLVNNGSAVLIYKLSGNPEQGLIETCGIGTATVLAVVGCILTVVAVRRVIVKTRSMPVVWDNLSE